jgi:hypothetical protein
MMGHFWRGKFFSLLLASDDFKFMYDVKVVSVVNYEKQANDPE